VSNNILIFLKVLFFSYYIDQNLCDWKNITFCAQVYSHWTIYLRPEGSSLNFSLRKWLYCRPFVLHKLSYRFVTCIVHALEWLGFQIAYISSHTPPPPFCRQAALLFVWWLMTVVTCARVNHARHLPLQVFISFLLAINFYLHFTPPHPPNPTTYLQFISLQCWETLWRLGPPCFANGVNVT
jgi:hypothetical protein